MDVVRRIAIRTNNGTVIEVDIGAKAENVLMPDGTPITENIESPLSEALEKAEPADSDAFVISEGDGEKKTVRLLISNFKNWLKAWLEKSFYTETEIDGKLNEKLDIKGDGKDTTVTFLDAAARVAPASGETQSTLWGKVKKLFTDLKPIAFSGSYADLTGVPDVSKPAIHAASHAAGGADPLAPANIGAVPTGRKVNGKALSADITLSAADVGAAATGHTHTAAQVGAIATSARGAANGVAPLGADLKIPAAYLNASADALTYGANGEAGKFDKLSTVPTATNPLRYNGYLRATRIFGVYYSDNADYAENYQVVGDIQPGELVMIGADGVLVRNTILGNPKVLGLVSTDPAHVIGTQPGCKTPIALAGRIPARVVGNCRPGDLLMGSDVPGALQVAGADVLRGAVVAQALESKDYDNVGQVMVLVMRM